MLLLALLAAACSRTPVQSATQEHRIEKGDHLDIDGLQLLDGRVIRISEPNREGTLLVFWATWCEICRAEVPALIELHGRESRSGIEVVGINVGEQIRRVRTYVTEYGIPFPVAADPQQQLMTKLGLETIPSIILVDNRGIVRYVGIHIPANLPSLVHALHQTGLND